MSTGGWVTTAILILRIVDKILGVLDRDQMIATGKSLALGEVLASIASKVADANKVKQVVAGMSDDDIAEFLRKRAAN